MKKIFYKGRFVFIPVAIAAFLSLISLVVMTLWNNLLPEIMNVSTITFWQAMGIFILSKILFGFGKGGKMSSGWMKHKCENLTPEEREKFRSEMKERMCGWNRNYKEDNRTDKQTLDS